MPIGTCRKCGAQVVWNGPEIRAHLARCPSQATPAPPEDAPAEDQ